MEMKECQVHFVATETFVASIIYIAVQMPCTNVTFKEKNTQILVDSLQFLSAHP